MVRLYMLGGGLRSLRNPPSVKGFPAVSRWTDAMVGRVNGLFSSGICCGPAPATVHRGGSSVPHRAPGSPGHNKPEHYLTGKAITYYRPRGSAEVRQLIDGGFQAFNAGRLSEACHIFADKMLAPEDDTTIGLTVAGALTPAGVGGGANQLMGNRLVALLIHARAP